MGTGGPEAAQGLLQSAKPLRVLGTTRYDGCRSEQTATSVIDEVNVLGCVTIHHTTLQAHQTYTLLVASLYSLYALMMQQPPATIEQMSLSGNRCNINV